MKRIREWARYDLQSVPRGLIAVLTLAAAAGWTRADDPDLERERAVIGARVVAQVKSGKTDGLGKDLRRLEEIEIRLYGPASEALTDTYEVWARVAQSRSDYEELVEVRRKLLDQRVAQAGGKSHWRVVTARLDLADAQARVELSKPQRAALAEAVRRPLAKQSYQPGRRTDAARSERERLAAIEGLVGTRNRAYVSGLVRLATVLSGDGDYGEAAKHLDRAAELAGPLYGDGHPDLAEILLLQSSVGLRSGNLENVGERLRRAKRLTADLPADEEAWVGRLAFGVAADNLGTLYRESGDLAAAAAEFRLAVDTFEKLGDAARTNHVVALGNLAGVHVRRGEYGRAIEAYRRALDEQARCDPADPHQRGWLLSCFAAVYVDVGDFDTALTRYLEAERLLKDGRPLAYADVLNNLGVLHGHRAAALRSRADFDAAIRRHGEALAIRRAEFEKAGGGADHPLVGRSHFHLGAAYAAAGRLPEAVAEYERARRIFRTRLAPDHLFVGELMNNLGNVHARSDRHREALAAYEDAARACRALPDTHPSRLNVEANTALTLSQLGRREEALARLRGVVEKWATFRDDAFDTLGKRQRLSFLLGHHHHLDQYLTMAVDGREPPEALYPVVAPHKGAVAARDEAERLARDHAEARPLVAEYLSVCAKIKALDRRVLSDTSPGGATALRELQGRKEELEVGMAAFGRYFRRAERDVVRRVCDRLPSDAALIDYHAYHHYTGKADADGHEEYERRLVAFVIRPGRPPVFQPLGPLAPVERTVRRWQQAVASGLEPGSGRDLAASIWDPLVPHLGGVKTVLVSPEGRLCEIPLAALPGKGDRSVLLDEFAFGYVPSVRQWLDHAPPPDPRPAGALVVGRMDYGVPPPGKRDGFSFLAPKPGEPPDGLDAILDGFRRLSPAADVRLRTGSDATAAWFREAFEPTRGPSGYRYVHLETHGFCTPLGESGWDAAGVGARPEFRDPHAGLRSAEFRTGVAFDRANESSANVLSGEEVAVLNLRGVDLLVLAACKGHAGDVVPNEGPLSLLRTFQSAGADTAVGSLWPVPLPETRALVAEFYRHLWALGGTRKLEALRNAQLAVRRNGGAEPLPPLFWAGWVLSGDPGDISDLKDPADPLAVVGPKAAVTEGGLLNPLVWAALGPVAVAAAVWMIRRRRR